MPTEPLHQKRLISIGADEVLVFAHRAGKTRREIARLAAHRLNGNILMSQSVQRSQQFELAATSKFFFRKRKAHHLTTRMNARIGASCAYRFDRATEHQPQRLFDASLHRKLAGLSRKTGKGLSVVRNQEGKDHLALSLFGCLLYCIAVVTGFH